MNTGSLLTRSLTGSTARFGLRTKNLLRGRGSSISAMAIATATTSTSTATFVQYADDNLDNLGIWVIWLFKGCPKKGCEFSLDF